MTVDTSKRLVQIITCMKRALFISRQQSFTDRTILSQVICSSFFFLIYSLHT